MKFISPSVTASPTASTNSSMPYAMPSKRRVSTCFPRIPAASLELAGILDRLLHVELDVPQLAVLLLDLADVHVLHDVARLRVDEDLAARALEDLALHGREQRVAAALSLGRLERAVGETHAVPGADGHEVGSEL